MTNDAGSPWAALFDPGPSVLALVCLLLRQPLEVWDWLYFTPVPGYRQLASWTQATCLSLTFPRRQVGWRRGGASLGSRPHAPGPLLSPHSRDTQAKAPTCHAAGSGTSVHLRGAASLGCSLFAYLGAGGCPVCQGLLVTSAQWLVPGAQ